MVIAHSSSLVFVRTALSVAYMRGGLEVRRYAPVWGRHFFGRLEIMPPLFSGRLPYRYGKSRVVVSVSNVSVSRLQRLGLDVIRLGLDVMRLIYIELQDLN